MLSLLRPYKKLNKEQSHVIKVVTAGNTLEWFDVYSFGYNSIILSELFFPMFSHLTGMFYAFLIFGIGFIFRPLGAIILGRIGDKVGRKKVFLLSILLVTLPSFGIGFLPTYTSWGLWSIILLLLFRVIQSFATGGELPAAICFLYENADEENKRYMTSWDALGNQLGAIIAIVEVFILENLMANKHLYAHGWRVSFLTGGIIGIIVLFFRHSMHETPVFTRLEKSHRLDNETLWQLFYNHRSKIWIGTAFGMIVGSTFYLVATYVPTFLDEYLGLTKNQNLLLSFVVMVFITILIPFFGRLGDRYSNRLLCCVSTLIIICLLPFMYVFLNNKNMLGLAISFALFLVPLACLSALIAYLIAHLFTPQVRFTGVGLAANVSDGIFGGLTPFIGLLFVKIFSNYSSILLYIFLCSIISIFYFLKKVR